jgi:hypothetical protein
VTGTISTHTAAHPDSKSTTTLNYMALAWKPLVVMKRILVDRFIYRGLLRYQRRHAAPSPDRDEPITTRMKKAHSMMPGERISQPY